MHEAGAKKRRRALETPCGAPICAGMRERGVAYSQQMALRRRGGMALSEPAREMHALNDFTL